MTIVNLYKIASSTLDNTGSGKISIGPTATNEYWWPTMIRVGSNSKTSPVPYCAVYHGGPSVLDPTTFIDDTSLGSGDTSSIIAGLVVRYGEVITAQFTGGNPGDVVVLVVSGVYSDLIDAIGPQVPGTHFAGKPALTVTNLIAQFPVGGSNVVASGTTQVGTLIDVRQWTSYYLTVSAVTQFPSGYNPIEFDLNWFNDSIGSVSVFPDVYEFWADNVGGGFNLQYGQMSMQDKVHGPYMRVNFTNHAAADSVAITWRLFGTTRDVGQPYARQATGVDGFILNQTGALVGGLATVPMPFSYGQTSLELFNNSTANVMNFFLGFGSTAQTSSLTTASADFLAQVGFGARLAIPNNQLVFPKRSAVIRIVGSGTDGYVVRQLTSFGRV